MILAEIPDPLYPNAIQQYATAHNFIIKEFTSKGEDFLELTKLIYACLDRASTKGCTQFALGRIRNEYNIMADTHTWAVMVYGFLPKVNALTQNRIV